MTARRQDILAGAEVLIARRGPKETTVAAIAKASGCATGSVYLHFSSKEEILEALATQRHDALRARLAACLHARVSCSEPAVDTTADAPWPQRLRAFFDARLDGFLRCEGTSDHGRELLCGDDPAGRCTSSGAGAAWRRFGDAQRDLLIDGLQQAKRAQALVVDDPELCAEALLTAYAAFCPPALWKIRPRHDALARQQALHVVVLYGLVPR